MHRMNTQFAIFLFCLFVFSPAFGQTNEELQKELETVTKKLNDMRHKFDQLEKSIDDLLWYERVGDIAHIDKVELTGPPLGKDRKVNLGSQDEHIYKTSPLRFKAYVFIPLNTDPEKKYPMLVLPHGGVHSNFKSHQYSHIVRELIAQGYALIAPEYRGSTGYGKRFYEFIDYGGLEINDTKACRDYMVDNYDFVDENRIGILGWSHGGLITLMNLFEFPEGYKVGYAGVPVSDLIFRMGNKTAAYRALYEVDYHIGESANDNLEEYKRRSPTWNAHKLQTPLLIHSNTNDADVTSTEVETLINALKAHNKTFEYEIYDNIPGGHAFDRIDLMSAKEFRLKAYRFLAKYLNPPNEFKNVKQLQKAGYKF
ncbi:MAG: prolyl oligopeptidase family serine peptidase [Bacteroidota bacterium]